MMPFSSKANQYLLGIFPFVTIVIFILKRILMKNANDEDKEEKKDDEFEKKIEKIKSEDVKRFLREARRNSKGIPPEVTSCTYLLKIIQHPTSKEEITNRLSFLKKMKSQKDACLDLTLIRDVVRERVARGDELMKLKPMSDRQRHMILSPDCEHLLMEFLKQIYPKKLKLDPKVFPEAANEPRTPKELKKAIEDEIEKLFYKDEPPMMFLDGNVNTKIKLLSKQKTILMINIESLKQSPYLYMILTGMGCNLDDYLCLPCGVIRTNIDEKFLNMIIEWCDHQVEKIIGQYLQNEYTNEDICYGPFVNIILDEWEEKFLRNLKNIDLLDLAAVAYKFLMHRLFDATCKLISNLFFGLNIQKIKNGREIYKHLTNEVIEKIRTENGIYGTKMTWPWPEQDTKSCK